MNVYMPFQNAQISLCENASRQRVHAFPRGGIQWALGGSDLFLYTYLLSLETLSILSEAFLSEAIISSMADAPISAASTRATSFPKIHDQAP